MHTGRVFHIWIFSIAAALSASGILQAVQYTSLIRPSLEWIAGSRNGSLEERSAIRSASALLEEARGASSVPAAFARSEGYLTMAILWSRLLGACLHLCGVLSRILLAVMFAMLALVRLSDRNALRNRAMIAGIAGVFFLLVFPGATLVSGEVSRVFMPRFTGGFMEPSDTLMDGVQMSLENGRELPERLTKGVTAASISRCVELIALPMVFIWLLYRMLVWFANCCFGSFGVKKLLKTFSGR